MPRTYKKHPPQGFNRFLTFIARYTYFNRDVRKDRLLIGIHQPKVSAFLDCPRRTLRDHIDKATQLGLLEFFDKHRYKNYQPYKSNRYFVDYYAILEYLSKQGIDPFENYMSAYQQIIDFGNSLPDPEVRSRLDKAKEARSKLIHADYCHGVVFNKVQNEYNDILRAKGLEQFIDYYIDDDNFRAFNILCSTPNPDNHKDGDPLSADTKRMDLLKEFGLVHPVELDVNGSIYRLTYNLNHDVQLPQNKDIYRMFWNALGVGKPFTKEVRKNFKPLCMPIYMMEQGIHTSWYNQVSAEMNPDLLSTKKEVERFYAMKFIEEYTGINLEVFLTCLANAMKFVLGVEKFYRRDIFLYESDLHAEMKMQLIKKGVMVLNCYDGFYGEEGIFTKELFYKTYKEAVTALKEVISERDKISGAKHLYIEDDEE